jgi:hypothetical protein
MQRNTIPDVFEIPAARGGSAMPWLTALAMVAIIVGATLALVVMNSEPAGQEPLVTVVR